MFYYHKGLTRAARRTVATAITIAGRQGCTAVDTGHLLLAMLQTGRGTAVEFLRRKQITVTALSACASQRACTGRPLHLRGRDLAPESRKALEFAVLGAHAARVNKAENEHLLCAMLEDTACTASVWLAGLGLEVPRAARECRQLSGQLVLPSSPRMSSTRGSRPSEKYGRDLTRLAQEGQLDPVLCRDDELERMIEILCRRPYSVVLFDEIEKAHSDIQNILLQILEDGTLTDAQGRKADFSNTIILLTSNLGARCLAGQASPLGFGAAAEETARRGKKALQEAKDYFRPELMGRLDDVVLFDPLGPAQLAAIADRLLCELEERAARQGYTLRHTPAAAAALAGDTVPAYGARELRRKVSRAVEQALADRIAAGTARPGVLFVADAAPDGHITLTMGDVAACAS